MLFKNEKKMNVVCRTIFKEGIKDIATYRVSRGEGVSEDFMIKGREGVGGSQRTS